MNILKFTNIYWLDNKWQFKSDEAGTSSKTCWKSRFESPYSFHLTRHNGFNINRQKKRIKKTMFKRIPSYSKNYIILKKNQNWEKVHTKITVSYKKEPIFSKPAIYDTRTASAFLTVLVKLYSSCPLDDPTAKIC